MPTTTSVAVQLLTRVPHQLRHRAKVHRGAHDTMLAQFVIDTLRERLETTPHADESAQRAAAR
jgi:hypothetical protein